MLGFRRAICRAGPTLLSFQNYWKENGITALKKTEREKSIRKRHSRVCTGTKKVLSMHIQEAQEGNPDSLSQLLNPLNVHHDAGFQILNVNAKFPYSPL